MSNLEHDEICKIHEEKFVNIEKRLDEHGEMLREHGNVYTRFLEKLTDMNENLVNLTKVETVNNQRISELTKIIEKHVESTTQVTKELAEKQDKQFEKLNLAKLDKDDYKNDLMKIKQLEDDFDKQKAKDEACDEIKREAEAKKKSNKRVIFAAAIGFIFGVISLLIKWLLQKFGINV